MRRMSEEEKKRKEDKTAHALFCKLAYKISNVYEMYSVLVELGFTLGEINKIYHKNYSIFMSVINCLDTWYETQFNGKNFFLELYDAFKSIDKEDMFESLYWDFYCPKEEERSSKKKRMSYI